MFDRGEEASVWRDRRARLFVAALAPLVVLLPLRLLLFGDADPFTLLILGPAYEECLKLACAILVLSLASLSLGGGRDPRIPLRYWLFLAPWVVGGGFGLLENLLAYPTQVGTLYTLREAAHAVFLALAIAAMLEAWRSLSDPYFGVAYGLAAGFAAHVGFNILAVVTALTNVGLLETTVYVVLVGVLAVSALLWEVRRVPSSREVRVFLPPPERRVHP